MHFCFSELERAGVTQWVDGWAAAEKPTPHSHYEFCLWMPVGMWNPGSQENVSFAEVPGVPCAANGVSVCRHGEYKHQGWVTEISWSWCQVWALGVTWHSHRVCAQGCYSHQKLGWRCYECWPAATANLQHWLCGSLLSLICGDISLLWIPENQAGSLLLRASHWRRGSVWNWCSWRLSMCAGIEIVHFSVRNN